MSNEVSRIESELEVRAYLQDMRYALDNGAELSFQIDRRVDAGRNLKYTNRYTVNELFPDENPQIALKRELKKLSVEDYLRTVKDTRFPNRSEMREFGKVYNGQDEIYIKVRVELLSSRAFGDHTVFVMSFHFAEKPFSEEHFPYKKAN